MKVPQKLEEYLGVLDRALGPVPVSDRADIITEIKSHVLEAQERTPERTLESILASLGEPEAVANRYLMERGLRPGKPPSRPVVKWLVIGFLGTMGIFTLGLGILIWNFTPILKVDEEKDRVVILGGLIDVDGKAGSVNIGGTRMKMDKEANLFSGSRPVDVKKLKTVELPFVNANLEIKSSLGDRLEWECALQGSDNKAFVTESNQKVTIDLTKFRGANCEIEVPEKLAVAIKGTNGNISFERPRFDVLVELTNGLVEFDRDQGAEYRYELKVNHGTIDNDFVNSTKPEAHKIVVNVTNGNIETN